MAKISKSYILTPPHPQGHGMSVKCEEPIDEVTVQVWLLYHHPNFNYWTLFVSGMELRTDGQTNRETDKRTDDPITRCPRQTFQAGGIKTLNQSMHLFCTLNLKFTEISTITVYENWITSTYLLSIIWHAQHTLIDTWQYNKSIQGTNMSPVIHNFDIKVWQQENETDRYAWLQNVRKINSLSTDHIIIWNFMTECKRIANHVYCTFSKLHDLQHHSTS